MARAPRGSGSSRRPRAEASTPTAGSGSSEAPASALVAPRTEPTPPSSLQGSAMLQEAVVTEPPADTAQVPSLETGESPAAPRFRIFIVDAGWNSAAHKVLVENFALIRGLQKHDPIYVLSREQSIEFQRHHGTRIGRDPIIAVHDLAAMHKTGTTDFHGFRLSL